MTTTHDAVRVILDEHASLSAMLTTFSQMVRLGPDASGAGSPERYFDVLRAMLFYIDAFPEKNHHPKESNLLFPRLARAAPQLMATIEQLERDHMSGEMRVRELMHLLMAWEYMGELHRPAFESEAQRYVSFYLDHMRLEETALLPVAQEVLADSDWAVLDEAFTRHTDPLNPRKPRDPQFDRLFTRIVLRAPAPLGLGEAEA
ncbi:MAG: hemerythrin domain-containing protein [Hydrogenophaga sp.]|jgi:hemerythrin-like domain-containing protein|uniref:hemerythrin domain-containing protein n=1 Tax=Hydrogenophaga sp. TaxID=1904254 RepID=UPI0026297D01|nr:hemerythrin domain-containing protein [Hydrogenophaga sp.]MCW5669415.1 hemerythrin domain-containing protein [Hydrogenophaga sp.]